MQPFFQNFNIYPFTVKENIILSEINNPVSDDNRAEHLLQQLKFSNTDENILNQQIDKEFYKNGINLSHGQNQKIALARALYSDAPFLLFDEPLSFQDILSEDSLLNYISSFKNEKTLVIISHNLEHILFVDTVFLLEEGRIIEQGSPKELLAANGKYKQLYDIQKKQRY